MEVTKLSRRFIRAFYMTCIFTLMGYIFLIYGPFKSTILNVGVFIMVMTVIDFLVLRWLKNSEKNGDETKC